MSLIYPRRTENRTDYFEISLGWEFGKSALDAFIWFTACVVWNDTAIPKPQISVIPPNPRVAKLSIAAIETDWRG
jgi:hypothetical protein